LVPPADEYGGPAPNTAGKANEQPVSSIVSTIGLVATTPPVERIPPYWPLNPAFIKWYLMQNERGAVVSNMLRNTVPVRLALFAGTSISPVESLVSPPASAIFPTDTGVKL
jgi:hypothetical protein